MTVSAQLLLLFVARTFHFGNRLEHSYCYGLSFALIFFVKRLHRNFVCKKKFSRYSQSKKDIESENMPGKDFTWGKGVQRVTSMAESLYNRKPGDLSIFWTHFKLMTFSATNNKSIRLTQV